jgi:cell division septation protein DedD
MTRMADPGRPRDDLEDDEQHFEDEGRRSIFSALWFRAILVVVVLGVVAAVAVPYLLELANQPPPKSTISARPETPPLPAPIAPPSAAPVTPPPPMERPAAVEQPPMAEKKSTAMPAPMPSERSAPTEKPVTARKSESAVAKEPATSAAAASGSYFVQVGAFKSQDSAKKLATRLRELKYNVDESSTSGAKSERRPAPGSSATSDKYDVYVTGGTPADINAKLGPKGFTSEPSAGGVIVKPSLPLRDAVALSKDLAVDGLKVQVRRASSGAPVSGPSTGSRAAASGDAVYRVRVGPFDDRGSATSTLRELEQRGYTPFIARGGQ